MGKPQQPRNADVAKAARPRRQLSAETREKMRQAALRRHARRRAQEQQDAR